MSVKNAVADSGAQITIVPASLLKQEGIAITGLRRSGMDLRAANNARINVEGVAEATISALSATGERFQTSTKVYVVRDVEEVYLSLDVLVGLQLVDDQFPAAGRNQHGCTYCASAASPPPCEGRPRTGPPAYGPIHIEHRGDEDVATQTIRVIRIQ